MWRARLCTTVAGRLARLFSISRHVETRAGAHRAGHAAHRQLATAETNSSG
jgi:hypothetical protein